MSADSPAPLAALRSIVLGFFPWLALVKLGKAKGLSFRTESSRLHLEGDVGDPAVARVTDLVDAGRLRFYPGTPAPAYTAPSIWYSPPGPPFAWNAVPITIITGPLDTQDGQLVEGVIVTGSEKVTCS